MLDEVGSLQGVGLDEMSGGGGVVASGVANGGHAEQQQKALCVREIGIGQQALLPGEVYIREFAAEELDQLEVREGGAGIVPRGGAEGLFRLLETAQLLEQGAQRAQTLGERRPQLNRAAKGEQGFVELALVLQDAAEGVVRVGIVRLQRNGAAAVDQGVAGHALLLQDMAEIHQDIDVIRRKLQRQAVALLGGVQLALLFQ